MYASPRINSLHRCCSPLVRRLPSIQYISTRRWQRCSSSSHSSSTSPPAPKSSEQEPAAPSSLSSHSHPHPYVQTSTSPHNSLSTFLTHARLTSLSPSSTVYIGTRYEYAAQDALRSLGFRLTRSGGRSDGGIDLHGTWTLPDSPRPLRCIVQCKALASAKVGPNLVRELEGTLASLRGDSYDEEVVGVLCATREASKGVREAVRRSRRGIVWVMLQDDTSCDHGHGVGVVRQVLWNERVAELGASGVGVGVVYGGSDGGDGNESRQDGREEVRLMWKGQVWEPEMQMAAEDKVPS